MFEVGSAIARIKADLSNFKAGMADAKNEANGLSSTLSSVGDGIADFGKKAAVFTGVVAAGFTLVAKSALESAAEFEQNRIAFETMLGSADKARALLKEISDFAMATPFELPQLVESSKKLLAYNVAAKDIIPTMKMLGDITSGVGTEKMPQLILAFGQVKAATKLTGAELRQFSEAGVPLLQALVDQANAAGGVLTKVGGSAKGAKVDIGEMNDKLAIAKQRLKEASDSGKAKESTMMSLRNTVQNYEATLAKANGTTGKAAGAMVRVKVTAAEMIEKISDGDIKFEDVQKALAGMTAEGGKFFNGMERQSKTFNGTVSNIKDQVGRLLRAVMGIDEGGDIRQGSIFDKLTEGATALLNALTAATPTILGAIDAIGKAFNDFMKTIQPFIDWIMANQELVLTFLKGLAIGIGALLVIGTITALVAALLNPLVLVVIAIGLLYTAWQTNFWGMRDIMTSAFNEMKAVWENILLPVITAIKDYIVANWDIIVERTTAIWNIIWGVIQVAWALIYGFLSVGIALLKGDWQAAWDNLVHAAKLGWEGLKDIFSGVVTLIKSWGGEVLDALVKPFVDAWNTIQDIARKIKDAMDPNKRHSPSLVDRVKTGVHDLNNAWNKLEMPVPRTTMATPAGVGAMSNPGGGMNAITLQISLDGAFIGDEFSAKRMAEIVGDNIIKKLQTQVRF